MGRARRVDAGLRPVAEHVDIDPHGRVVPQNDEARRALADRAGRFALLPSAPDLLVARRVPVAGGTPPGARCILAGDLSGLPLADFIAFAHQARLSGVLAVSARGAERAVAFHDGEVRGARSDAPGERIGEVAARLGYLQPDALPRSAGDGPMGRALVEEGLLSPPDLWKCLHEQVAAIFEAILLVEDGVFSFLADPDVDFGAPLAANTQSLLMDAIRRIDEMTLFRARIPGLDSYLRRRQPRAAITLKPVEQQVVDLVDGRRRVADVANALHLGEFEATKVLYHLAEAGYVEAVADPMAVPGASVEERLAAMADGMNAIFRLITAAVGAATGSDAFLAAVRKFLSDPAGPHAALWRSIAPGRDGGLDARALLGGLAGLGSSLVDADRPGETARYLFDALRELMFFYLFQAGELLPRDADERLQREVKRRFETLGDLR